MWKTDVGNSELSYFTDRPQSASPTLADAVAYRPPLCSSRWKFGCSFGVCISPSSPAETKNFRLVPIFGDLSLTCIPNRANPLSRRAGPSMPDAEVNHKALSVKSLITPRSLFQNCLTSAIPPLSLIIFTGGCCLSQLFRQTPFRRNNEP